MRGPRMTRGISGWREWSNEEARADLRRRTDEAEIDRRHMWGSYGRRRTSGEGERYPYEEEGPRRGHGEFYGGGSGGSEGGRGFEERGGSEGRRYASGPRPGRSEGAFGRRGYGASESGPGGRGYGGFGAGRRGYGSESFESTPGYGRGHRGFESESDYQGRGSRGFEGEGAYEGRFYRGFEGEEEDEGSGYGGFEGEGGYEGRGYRGSEGEGGYEARGYRGSEGEGDYEGRGYRGSAGEGDYEGRGYRGSEGEGDYEGRGYRGFEEEGGYEGRGLGRSYEGGRWSAGGVREGFPDPEEEPSFRSRGGRGEQGGAGSRPRRRWASPHSEGWGSWSGEEGRHPNRGFGGYGGGGYGGSYGGIGPGPAGRGSPGGTPGGFSGTGSISGGFGLRSGWEPERMGIRSSERERERRRGWEDEGPLVGDLMTRDPQVVGPDASVRDAARVMREEDTGIVPVVLDGRVLGVITDRDLTIRVLAEGRDASSVKCREAMTEDVETCSPKDRLVDVVRIMGEDQLRRMPVVGRDDRIQGIISMTDIAREAELDYALQEALEQIASRRSFWSKW